MSHDHWLECVPNFSEGLDAATIGAIADAIRSVEGAYLLHIDRGAGVNRTVMTLAGPAAAVVEAAYQAIAAAATHIDMRQHRGTHPRLGATDVCPLVPLGSTPMAVAVEWAERLAQRVGEELQIPVFCYEQNARTPDRRNLARIRAGEYEGLATKIQRPDWQPDYGPALFNPRTGATAIGARHFLIAYNINLSTNDVSVAQAMAAEIRESGSKTRNASGHIVQHPGRFRGLKAIGWYLAEYGHTQVSCNVVDFRTAPLHEVFEACIVCARQFGVQVIGSEIIGLVPHAALLAAGQFYAPQASETLQLEQAVRHLGLLSVGPFDLSERILEERLRVVTGTVQ